MKNTNTKLHNKTMNTFWLTNTMTSHTGHVYVDDVIIQCQINEPIREVDYTSRGYLQWTNETAIEWHVASTAQQ